MSRLEQGQKALEPLLAVRQREIPPFQLGEILNEVIGGESVEPAKPLVDRRPEPGVVFDQCGFDLGFEPV
jgi:hypothetical protein